MNFCAGPPSAFACLNLPNRPALRSFFSIRCSTDSTAHLDSEKFYASKGKTFEAVNDDYADVQSLKP